MKPEDLMIGDWFRFRYTIDGKEIVKTFRISRIVDDIGHVWGDGFGCMCKPERLEPIPLTPEILEKNGFVETDVVVVGTRKMIWESEDGRTEITIWMDDTMPMQIRKNIYYEDEVCYTLPFACVVRELQHALRLCGIDKTIVL